MIVYLANKETSREDTLKECGKLARRSLRRRLVRLSTAEASAKEVAVQNSSLSPNRRIPNGSWCLFREVSDGSRNGKVVIVQSRDIQDPDTDGQTTVKIYQSEKTVYNGILIAPTSPCVSHPRCVLPTLP